MFEGEAIAITGGASGIGYATAERIVSRGGRVAVIDLREDTSLDAAKRLDPSGERAFGLVADVTDPAAIETALGRTRERFGRFDGATWPIPFCCSPCSRCSR